MSYNSCRMTNTQKSVLKYEPTCKNVMLNARLNASILLTQHKNIIVYIKLHTKETFWFYIHDCSDTHLIGCKLKDEQWFRYVIELSDILGFY
ncbi:MAG: hypothetical protein ACK5I7_05725 [Anaerotignum sp.]